MVEDVAAQDAAFFVNQQVLAAKDTIQEYQVQARRPLGSAGDPALLRA